MYKFYMALIVFSISIFAQNFGDHFLNKTLRFDYYETGDQKSSIFSFGEMIEEPFWGGSKINLIDTLFYGNYFFEVYELNSENLIYSRGYSTLFQEWQTTDEAKETKVTFSGSVILPFPKNSVKLIFYKRNSRAKFEEVFNYTIDPNDYRIKKERRSIFPAFDIQIAQDPDISYDFVILPEGYTAGEMGKFKDDCKRFSNYLFKYSPFKENKDIISLRGVAAPSEESGTDIPGKNIWKHTLLNSNFYTFGSERYLMTTDFKSVRDIASNAPYDQIVILVNSKKYGGGGIYNFYSLTVADHPTSEQVFIHELGHGIAGLADEYYTSDVAYSEFYPLDVEPWEKNITTLIDFDIKWKLDMDEDTPIPTPQTEQYENTVGVFEGGGYSQRGIFRPSQTSIMLELSADGYNEVSENTIDEVLKYFSK